MIKRKVLKIKAWLVMKKAEKIHAKISEQYAELEDWQKDKMIKQELRQIEMQEIADLHRQKNYRYGSS